MINIRIPATYLPEREYIFDVVLADWLGLSYALEPTQTDATIVIEVGDMRLILADVLFQTPQADWLKPASLPVLPLDTWQPPAELGFERQPIIYGQKRDDQYLIQGDGLIDECYLGIDVFGSAFFMLTRYEEIAKPEHDSHERFYAAASLAHQAGFLSRPIINEYIDVLWWCLSKQFPTLERKPRTFNIHISHDVDQPYGGAGRSLPLVLKSMAGDLRKRRPIPVALERAAAWAKQDYAHDPCNTFDYLMDESEKRNLKSAFYFICGHSGGAIDGDYTLDNPRIQSLMTQIHQRGHEIGLHPSYNTFRSPETMETEFNQLRRVCDELNIKQAQWGGRQHYLRWENPTTWQLWDDLGLAYDSSLGFADALGFRSGICDPYPVFNLHTRQKLTLREIPLILPEFTLWEYIGLGERSVDGALKLVEPIIRAVRRHNGTLTLLWHNHNFRFEAQKRLYERILDRALERVSF